MTPYPTTSDRKTAAKQTGGAIHKPEAPSSHSRQERVTSIKDGRTPNPCSPEPRQRGDGCRPKPWTWKHTAISIRTVRHRRRRARHPRRADETGTRSDRHQPSPSSSPSASICRQRQRHPRTGMETASIQPSRDDDVARVPASIFVFPPDRFLGAPCHGARRDVNGPRDPRGAPRGPLPPRRAPRHSAGVTTRKGPRRGTPRPSTTPQTTPGRTSHTPTSSTTYATPDTSPPPDTRHRSPRPESTPGRRPSDRHGMAGPDGPCPPLTDQQNVNAIIITIIAIY